MTTTSRATPTRAKGKAAAQPKAHFDVSAIMAELDDSEAVEDFTVLLPGGRTAALRNPDELGWKEAAALSPSEPFLMMRTIVRDEDWEAFVEADFPVKVMKRLVSDWREHYGLPPLGE